MSDLEPLARILRQRRSVRHYTSEPVPALVIAQLVEAASYAPSAGNRQDWEFTIVTSDAAKEAMAGAVRQCWAELLSDPDASGAAEGLREYARHFDWFARAPVVIAVSTKRPDAFFSALCGEAAGSVQGGAASAAMAAQNLMLAAHAMGLGTCCLTGPLAAGNRLKEILKLGNRRELVCLITLGYPAQEAVAPGRKLVGEIMRYVE